MIEGVKLNKEPFIINFGTEELNNISDDSGISFKYNKNNIWNKNSIDNTLILEEINKKLDIVIDLLKDK